MICESQNDDERQRVQFSSDDDIKVDRAEREYWKGRKKL